MKIYPHIKQTTTYTGSPSTRDSDYNQTSGEFWEPGGEPCAGRSTREMSRAIPRGVSDDPGKNATFISIIAV